jgi:hypothetical protein
MSEEPDFATAITLLTAYMGGINVSFDIPEPVVAIKGLAGIAQKMLESMLIALDDDGVALVDGDAAGDIIVQHLLPIASISLDALENVSGISAENLLRNMALQVASQEA